MVIDYLIKNNLLPIPISKYYEMLTYAERNKFCIGQIVTGFVSYPIQNNLHVLIPKDYDPTEQTETKYVVRPFNFDSMENNTHRPIKGDNLEYDEFYIVQKGKVRPCVILNIYQSRFDNSKYDENIYLCAPIFTLKTKHDDRYILDMIKFDVPSEFFLPHDTRGINNHSAIRFSRIVPLFKKNIKAAECSIEGNKPFKLSEETLKYVLYHLAKYFSYDYKLSNDIEGYQSFYRELIEASVTN